MNEYLGIYDEEWIELHLIKILANTDEEAENKFLNHLNSKINSIVFKDKVHVIPLFDYLEII